MIGETAMSRFIDSCHKTLESFRVSYRSQALTQLTCIKLARCPNLKEVEFGQHLDKYEKIPFDVIGAIKMFARKCVSHTLTVLKLYECDAELLGILAQRLHRVEELQIVKFLQKDSESVSELLPLSQMKSVKKLNLCSTWFPLKFSVAADDNGMDVMGNRDFERVIWGLKNSLTHLLLGDYLHDSLLIYIAIMCKQVEVMQLNSAQLTDGSIYHVLKSCTQLTALDVSGCLKFTGAAFQEVDEDEYKATKLRWLQVNLDGYEM